MPHFAEKRGFLMGQRLRYAKIARQCPFQSINSTLGLLWGAKDAGDDVKYL
jgi:hypothetical protein